MMIVKCESGSGSGHRRGTVGAVVARRVPEGMMVMIRRYERNSGSGRLSKV